MSILNGKTKLPALLSLGSLLSLILVLTTTSPINKIGYAVIFFAIFLVFLISLGHLVILLQTGKVTRATRYRLVALSLFIIIILMFRSAQSLNWVDILVLALIVFGFIFYIGRRSTEP